MSDWRTIDSAPVGPQLLLWTPKGGCVIAPMSVLPLPDEIRAFKQTIWRSGNVELIRTMDDGWNPTHWQPLPEGPE